MTMDAKCMSDFPAAMPGRAELERAATTRTNLLLVAPPGLGTTMLAQRATGILPGEGRPFRAPHYTVSAASMVGTPARGPRAARMGELGYAHGGVLFLDSLHEFSTVTIGAIADAIRHGSANGYACKPVMVIATTMPCPCGAKGGTMIRCVCSPMATSLHARRVDELAKKLRIENHVAMDSVTVHQLRGAPRGETSEAIRARVNAAWVAEFAAAEVRA
jgi:magnesium chelatase family protein